MSKHILTGISGKSTHSAKLERWLGAETLERISREVKGFYYPLPLHGVPGNVRVMPDGSFAGEIMAGEYFTKEDGAAAALKKIKAIAEQKYKKNKALSTLLDMIKSGDSRLASVGAFASIDAVVAAYTGGKGQQNWFNKAGTAPTAINGCMDMWTNTGWPAAGAAGAAAPTGTTPTSATTGAMTYRNGVSTNSNHYLNWSLSASVITNSLLLYDRLFSVAKTMNSTATEAVTGTLTRYTNATTTAIDYIGGNFCFPSIPTTVLAATAHNWTVCQYTNQAGTTGQSFPSIAGISACAVHQIDLALGSWFMPLVAGDFGVKALTQMQCSAAVATGTVDFVIGHPIAINACPIANLACLDDGLYTSMNLIPILDNACLTFLELPKAAASACSYSGIARFVSE